MTGATTAPLDVLVDVNKVEIATAVPEFRQRLRLRLLGYLGIVAIEAEGVFLFGVGRVEFLGKILAKNPVIHAAVGIMTRIAVTLLYGAVLMFLGCHVFPQFRMASEAKSLRCDLEHLRKIGSMGIVAFHAGPTGHWRMGSGGQGVGLDIIVAQEAQSGSVLI